jgi:hypothetical protein
MLYQGVDAPTKGAAQAVQKQKRAGEARDEEMQGCSVL